MITYDSESECLYFYLEVSDITIPFECISTSCSCIPVIPPFEPFTRVNHAKFMVTDKKAFVSTSNWIGDYFLTTAGASFVTDHPQVLLFRDFPCIAI
jgi:hypothetical protein